MSRFLLVTRSAEYESRLKRLLRSHVQAVPGEYLIFGAEELFGQIEGVPRVALLGPLLSFDETKSLSTALTERFPGIGVIVVREQRSDLEDWVDAMEIHAVLSPEADDGAVDALLSRLDAWLVTSGRLAPPTDEATETIEADEAERPPLVELLDAELAAAAAQAEQDDDIEQEDRAGRDQVEPWSLPELGPGVPTEVVVITAPKGGQGKTTLAINIATGLAECAPNSVVLVDGDLQFGDIANSLAITPHYTLPDVISAGDDEVALKALLTRHDDAFFVVAAPASPELADSVSAAAFGMLLQRLSGLFRFVVVDTTPGLGEHTLSALECATDGVFVTAMAVPSLRALRREFEVLVAAEMLPVNRHLVVNFVEKNNGLLLKDAEAIVGAPFDVVIPRSIEVVLAANAGAALIHRNARDSAAKALRAAVRRIEPATAPSKKLIHRRVRRHESE